MITNAYPIALRSQYNTNQTSFSARKHQDYQEYDDEPKKQKSYAKPIILGTLAVAAGALLIAKKRNITEFFKSLSEKMDSTRIYIDRLEVNKPTIIGSDVTVNGGTLGSFKTGKDNKVTILNGVAENSTFKNSEFSADCKLQFKNSHLRHAEASTPTGERFSIVDYKTPKDKKVTLVEIAKDIIDNTGKPIT